VAHNTPIVGYRTDTCNTLRLWKAEASESFDFQAFNRGGYYGAVEDKMASETVSKVLYPNDETRYRIGPGFLDFVHFYDSHTITRLDYVDGELVPVEVIDSRDDCAIIFDEVTLTPEFLGGASTIAPLCPKCGHAEEEWGEMLNDWYYRKA